YLSAKLGIVTDHDLPEMVRARFPRAVTWGMWVQAELIAMSTDIAEFLGAALGLNLLFGVPLLPAGLITGVVAFAILELQRRRLRRRAACLGRVVLQLWYRCRPGRDGGLHQRQDPAARTPGRDDDAGADHPRDRHEPHARARAQPGRAVLRHPLRARAARDAHL